MLQCKLTQGSSNFWVQDVKTALQLISILCFDWELNDLVYFLSYNQCFSVLTVDTTYKLDDFNVAPMTYHHLMLKDIKTKKYPIMLGGSLLVH